MNRTGARRLFLLLVAIAAAAVVGVVAYNVGTGVDHGTIRMFGPMRGNFGGYGYTYGFGPFALFGALLIGFLVVWLFVVVLSGLSAGASRRSTDLTGVDRLRELSEMHEKGALSDEEFAAAKRKLLGL
jgi:uncharacterized membrane protein